MNKEALKICLPIMKEAMGKVENMSYTDSLLENIRDLLECLLLQNTMMMTDEQFKDFQDELEYQVIDILIRLDIDGPPHTNPQVKTVPLPYLKPYNGKTIECPHLHLYVENYGDKWAIPCTSDNFTDTTDLFQTLLEFFDYCNIKQKPKIVKMSLTGFS